MTSNPDPSPSHHDQEAQAWRARLLNPAWLQEKLDQSDTQALLAECAAYLQKVERDETIALLESALGLSVQVLAKDKLALPGQLAGRLMSHRGKPEIGALLSSIQADWPNEIYPVHLDYAQAINMQAGPLIRILVGHTSWVMDAVYSPDGAFILSASEDFTIRVWQVVTGELLRTLKGHTREVINAVYSPNGAFIISASMDKTLRVWRATTGEQLAIFYGDAPFHCKIATRAAEDGALLIAAGDNMGRVLHWRWQPPHH